MPRTCLACASLQREEIDKALVEGVPLRNMAERVPISPQSLLRHKQHVSEAIVKASEKREERLGDSLLGEMQRVQQKAWELLSRAETEGDTRGAVVALREVRGCLESLGEMLSLAPNGLDLAATPDEAILAEAERRGIKLPLNLQVTFEHSPVPPRRGAAPTLQAADHLPTRTNPSRN